MRAGKYGTIGGPEEPGRRNETGAVPFVSAMAEKGTIMRTCLYVAAVSLALASMAEPAAAKGCLRGAFMGGVAGHYVAHHGVLGAAAGCLIGRHQANKRERERAGYDRGYDGGYDRSYNRYDRGQPIGTTYR